MDKFEIIITTLFGLEALVSKEIRNLGYETLNVSDGRVTFLGDMEAVYLANLWVRCGERVLIKIGSYEATSFDELFEGSKALDWSKWLFRDSAFPVSGFSVKSKLTSIPDCQSILKKSIVSCLTEKYGISWFPEDGPCYKIEFSILKDVVTLMIDTSGSSLYKRGYKRNNHPASIRETIAASIATLSRFSYNGVFADPFCGSGTIPIEAALIAKNVAPGMNRDFGFMEFDQFDETEWDNLLEEAGDLIKTDTKIEILASDIDPTYVELTLTNSKNAKVSELISVKQLAVKDFESNLSDGTIVCNPPYGERLNDVKTAEIISRDLGASFKNLNNWGLNVITPLENFENLVGRKADKKRKIYNGMIKCDLYMYLRRRT